MTLAVLSDIHSNHLALAACLAAAKRRGVSAYIFLGDYISDCAYPQKTLALLYDWAASHDCRFILGNREEYMAAYADGKITGWQNGSATGSLLYTYENLSAKDLAWFRTLANVGCGDFPGHPPFLYCHGAPWQTTGTLPEGSPAATEKLRALPEGCILCGHTHRMGVYLLAGPGPTPKTIARAGSVGYPLTTPGQAQMLLLHSTEDGAPRWYPEYVLVPYDVQAAVQELYTSGLMERAPVWSAMTAHALLTGENMAGLLPPYAQSLYEKDTGQKVPYPAIPEPYWQKAAGVFHCQK